MSTVVSMNAASFAAPPRRLRPAPAVAPAGQPHLRLTRRGRFVLTTLAATPFVIAALVFGINAGGATATQTGSSVPLQSVTITSGETLWQLAGTLAPNADPRDFIADVMQLNQLDSADLHPGQSIDIPAQYSK